MTTPAAFTELASVAAACAEFTSADTLDDDDLLDSQRSLATSIRLIEVAASTLAAAVAYRSRRELGYKGLAQKRGARTPEALVQQLTGTSAAASRRLVSVGTLVATECDPWLAPATTALVTGGVSLEGVEAIRSGLGAPTETIAPDALTEATRTLTNLAPTLTLEKLSARARELRDELDIAGVAEREAERRERRSLRLYPQSDGMTRLVGLLDPESAAVLAGAIDVATSPRRGGPRFVNLEDAQKAEQIVADPRTTEQLALDAVVELVDVAVSARVSTKPGARRADVRVLVTQGDLDRGSGVGFIDGQSAAISIATVKRFVCDGGAVPVLFDDNGGALNLGRSQRLHNARQRAVITARDGGCLVPGCDRGAAWSEVHHINEYAKGGATDVDDGVLLCRHHHMLVHNNGWCLRRTGHEYALIPPPAIDPRQIPIPLASKSPVIRRLLATA